MKRLDVFNTMDKLLDSLNVKNNKTLAHMDNAKSYVDYKGYGTYYLVINDDDVTCWTRNDLLFNTIASNSLGYALSIGGKGFEVEINNTFGGRKYGTFKKWQ